ncbi:MAG TPA: hypothetical protein VIV61_09725 [Candidatus Ozemobacteraceae bacterium]
MRRGSAAIILTIIILGFMMAISTSYVTMVQTETRFQTSQDKAARAQDAAFAGVGYVIARLLATSSTFLVDSTQASIKSKRLYFAYSRNAYDVTARFDDFDAAPTATFQNVASSQWLYPVSQGMLLADEMASSVAFLVTTYPAPDPTDTTPPYNVVPNYYYVKSQGMYRDIEPNGLVTATYSAQLLARLLIATPTFQVKLERYQPMEVEIDWNNAPFFLTPKFIYP